MLDFIDQYGRRGLVGYLIVHKNAHNTQESVFFGHVWCTSQKVDSLLFPNQGIMMFRPFKLILKSAVQHDYVKRNNWPQQWG